MRPCSVLAIFAFPLMVGVAIQAHATPYNVSLETTLLTGTDGVLALDFIDGGPPSGNVSVTDFHTDGTLLLQMSSGDVTGALPGPVVLADGDFFNELLVTLTFGSTLSFVFTPTTMAPMPPSLPDSFSVFLLDPVSLLPLFPTSDPTGSNALFHLDIDGTPTGFLSVFEIPGEEIVLRVRPAGVPEPETIGLLLAALAPILALRRGI